MVGAVLARYIEMVRCWSGGGGGGLYWPGVWRWPGVAVVGAVLTRCIEVARCCSGGGCIGQVYRDGQVLEWGRGGGCIGQVYGGGQVLQWWGLY